MLKNFTYLNLCFWTHSVEEKAHFATIALESLETQVKVAAGFIQASISKLQGLLKASPTVFKDLKLMKILI